MDIKDLGGALFDAIFNQKKDAKGPGPAPKSKSSPQNDRRRMEQTKASIVNRNERKKRGLATNVKKGGIVKATVDGRGTRGSRRATGSDDYLKGTSWTGKQSWVSPSKERITDKQRKQHGLDKKTEKKSNDGKPLIAHRNAGSSRQDFIDSRRDKWIDDLSDGLWGTGFGASKPRESQIKAFEDQWGREWDIRHGDEDRKIAERGLGWWYDQDLDSDKMNKTGLAIGLAAPAIINRGLRFAKDAYKSAKYGEAAMRANRASKGIHASAPIMTKGGEHTGAFRGFGDHASFADEYMNFGGKAKRAPGLAGPVVNTTPFGPESVLSHFDDLYDDAVELFTKPPKSSHGAPAWPKPRMIDRTDEANRMFGQARGGKAMDGQLSFDDVSPNEYLDQQARSRGFIDREDMDDVIMTPGQYRLFKMYGEF